MQVKQKEQNLTKNDLFLGIFLGMCVYTVPPSRIKQNPSKYVLMKLSSGHLPVCFLE